MGWHARSEIGFVQMVDNFLVDWIIGVCVCVCVCCLQCFDAVGWAAGRASGL